MTDQAVQEGQTDPKNGVEAQDSTSFFKQAYSQGREKERKDAANRLKSLFGVETWEEAAPIIQEWTEGTKKTKQAAESEIQKLIKHNETLMAELTGLRQAETVARQKAEISADLSKSGIEFLNARAQDAMVSEFLNRYEIKEGYVFQKGDVPAPVFTADKRQALPSDVMRELAKQPDFTGFIKQPSAVKHGEPGVKQSEQGYRPTADERMNAQFQQAVRQSGQWVQFVSGQPLDKGRLDRFLK